MNPRVSRLEASPSIQLAGSPRARMVPLLGGFYRFCNGLGIVGDRNVVVNSHLAVEVDVVEHTGVLAGEQAASLGVEEAIAEAILKGGAQGDDILGSPATAQAPRSSRWLSARVNGQALCLGTAVHESWNTRYFGVGLHHRAAADVCPVDALGVNGDAWGWF